MKLSLGARQSLFALFLVSSLSFHALALPHGTTPQELLNAGRVDEAVSALQKKISDSAGDAEAYHLLCRAYYSLEAWDQSVKAGERSVELAPGKSEYHLWLGRAYGSKAEKASVFSAPGLAKRAREQFEKAVELNGRDIHARSDLAEFYLEAPAIVGGGKEKARAQGDALFKLDPALGHWVNARLAEKDKDFGTAEREYKSAIAASNGDPVRWLNLASFYRRQNRLPEMEEAINKAVGKQRKPNNVLIDAANLLLRAGRNLPGASQLVTKYLSAKDQNEEAPAFYAHYILGQILEKQGDRAGAMKEYKAALQLAQSYESARAALNRLQKQR